MTWKILRGDCVEQMAAMLAESVDAVVCDPPYGLEFMGKSWDRLGDIGQASHRGPDAIWPNVKAAEGRRMQDWHEAWSREALRVLKPGGHLLAFGGTRTYHRLTAGIEDAGFEIRDTIAYMYGSGFPKSLNVGRAIDAPHYGPVCEDGWITPDARRWGGHGSALKPSHEPIVVARKPLSGTVAATVLEHGTGALNIDGCRIGLDGAEAHTTPARPGLGANGIYGASTVAEVPTNEELPRYNLAGRWPPNAVFSHHESCVPVGTRRVRASRPASGPTLSATESVAHGEYNGDRDEVPNYADADGLETVEAWDCSPECPVGQLGEPARFFFTAKASSSERSAGLGGAIEGAYRNTHPT